MFKDYVLVFHKEAILSILNDGEASKHFPVNVNFVELFEHEPALGNHILTNPESTLKQCDDILLEAQQELIDRHTDRLVLTKKHNVHTRIYGLPACPELHKVIFPTNQDLGLFLQISGTITRISAVKMFEYRREYMCTKCKYKFVIEANYEEKYLISPPKRCMNPDFCKSSNFRVVSALDTNHCKDYQEFKMQEQVSKLQVSTMPSALWVTLEEDLVDICKPGDSVTICGTVKRRWKIPSSGKLLEVELVIKANHIEVNNDTSSTTVITSEILENFSHFWETHKTFPLYGRDLILRSFCPQIYGMFVVKLAIATVLAGGSTFEKDKNTGMRVRTEPHLLLVGDPGMGKSQLLRYASKVIPRSVLTTGVGSTSAGLTVAAVMEDGEWHLEGGALVLADGGICCIDEFNSMKEHDRTSIHEAMEQQTISVAKASIVSKLSTRCSILAATNPKLSMDQNESLTITVALASPLLSRFDLILFLKDSMDDDWDEKVSNYILRGYKRKSKFFDKKYNMWSLEMLQAYFLIIKKLNPVLTDTSKQILGAYYQLQRKMETRDKSRTTVRLLDSLVRLSQAHARLMCHQEVETMDAIMALALVEISMSGSSSKISEYFDPHSDFLDDPMKNYENLIKIILPELHLDDILESEINLLKSYENGEVIKTSRVDIMEINVFPEISERNKKDKAEINVLLEMNEKNKKDKAEITIFPEINEKNKKYKGEINVFPEMNEKNKKDKVEINVFPEMSEKNKNDKDYIKQTKNQFDNKEKKFKTESRSNRLSLHCKTNNDSQESLMIRNNLDVLIREYEKNENNSQRNNSLSTSAIKSNEEVDDKLDKSKKIQRHDNENHSRVIKKRKITGNKIAENVENSFENSKRISKEDCKSVLLKADVNESINSDIFSKALEDPFNAIPKSTQKDFGNINNPTIKTISASEDINLINSDLEEITNFEINCHFKENNFSPQKLNRNTNRNVNNLNCFNNKSDFNKKQSLFLNADEKSNDFISAKDTLRMDIKNDMDVLDLIPSAVYSQELQDAFNYVPENEDVDAGSFKKNSSRHSLVKSDSGHFSSNSQSIFESIDDLDESELDI